MRGISIVGCGYSLIVEVIGISQTVGVAAVSSIICTGLPKTRDVSGVRKVLMF